MTEPHDQHQKASVPFPPFRAESSDPSETMLAFFNYLCESHVRLHRHAEAQGRYLQSIYEMMWKAGMQPGSPPQHPVMQRPALSLGSIAEGARILAENADAFRHVIKAFFRGRG